MERPQFIHPIRPFVAAWLAGEITAGQSLVMQYRDEIAHHSAVLRDGCPPICRDYHRRERVRSYLNLRGMRRRMQ